MILLKTRLQYHILISDPIENFALLVVIIVAHNTGCKIFPPQPFVLNTNW